jgi:signal transduction histidine kinase/ligand-binding sensor domain-containing protein
MARPQRQNSTLIALGILVAWCPSAFALDPSLDVSQYAHTSWKIREGFTKGTITSIAQTPDGYLWLGTEFGLLRFDGVRSVPWQPPAGEHLPDTYVRSLLAARGGTLWIGTAQGLASWKNGKLALYPELAGKVVNALLQDHEGTVWAGAQAYPSGRLCAIQNGRVRCYGQDGTLGQSAEPLYEDALDNLWVGGLAGLWRWRPGPGKPYPMPSSEGIHGLLEGESGALLISQSSGIRQLVNGKTEAYALRVARRHFSPREMLRDRDGSLWIGTKDVGIVHEHEGRVDVFGEPDGLSGNFIEKLFEDREGNVWVSTLDGLDRFCDFAVPTISVRQGLSNPVVESVLSARDGSVWLGTVDGLDRWHNGQITIYRKGGARVTSSGTKRQQDRSKPGVFEAARQITDDGLPDNAIESLFQDDLGQIWASTFHGVAYLKNGRFITVSGVPGAVHSIAEDRSGNVWISQDQSLFRLRGEIVVERIPWTQLGRPDGARSLVADPTEDGLWLGFRDGGLGYLKDGHLRATCTVADGLGAGHIRDLHLGRGGVLWASTEAGLSRLKDGHIATLSSQNGLPCDAILWAMEDDQHSFWLSTACGLVRIGRPEMETWVATADRNPKQMIRFTLFDSSDGVRYHTSSTGYSPSVAKSQDGRIWFLPWDGVSVIDPRHLPFNRLAPPVEVERVIADHRSYDILLGQPLRLPPSIRDLEIDYTALSLVAPEKVLFRYKLESWDRDWQDAGSRRQAFYTNLSPRTYRFRVIACNNNGVWNNAGATLDFSIAPYFDETLWFRIACFTIFALLLWMLYQLRLRTVRQRYLERSRAAEALRRAQADLAHIHRVSTVGELTASLAHEINQPIGAAVANAEACLRFLDREQPDVADAREAALEMARDARHAADIIDRVRSLYRKGSSQREMVDVNEVIQEMVRMLRNEANRYSVAIDTALAESLPKVMADRVQLQQVLMNLMLNAIEAMRDATGELGIRSQLTEDGEVLVSVADTGVGLLTEKADQIFQAFFTTKPQGTGMGLAITRSIIEAHGGRVWATANSGRGTTFQFTLPVRLEMSA